jgi:hypothetical protein
MKTIGSNLSSISIILIILFWLGITAYFIFEDIEIYGFLLYSMPTAGPVLTISILSWAKENMM